jgi:hypothetical protein
MFAFTRVASLGEYELFASDPLACAFMPEDASVETNHGRVPFPIDVSTQSPAPSVSPPAFPIPILPGGTSIGTDQPFSRPPPAHRCPKGTGYEHEAVAEILERPEHADVRDYNRKRHPYALDLTEILARWTIPILQGVIREVEARLKMDGRQDKCPRIWKRSERLMVKWLHARREFIPTKQAPADPPPPLPAVGEAAPPILAPDPFFDDFPGFDPAEWEPAEGGGEPFDLFSGVDDH